MSGSDSRDLMMEQKYKELFVYNKNKEKAN
jgi:hypothetical protein